MNLTKLRYHGFFKNNPEVTRRTIDRLRELKLWMARPEADGGGGVPPKDTDATLLLATWNIRDFGKNKGYGDRTLEPLHYMAQIDPERDAGIVEETDEGFPFQPAQPRPAPEAPVDDSLGDVY